MAALLDSVMKQYSWKSEFLTTFGGSIVYEISTNSVDKIRWDILKSGLLVVQLLKNFPKFYGTLTSIAMFTKALHLSLS
jgi:hypothetical protein